MSMKNSEINIILLRYYFKKINFKFFTSFSHSIISCEWLRGWTMRLNCSSVESENLNSKYFDNVLWNQVTKYWILLVIDRVDCNLLFQGRSQKFLKGELWIFFHTFSIFGTGQIFFHTNFNLEGGPDPLELLPGYAFVLFMKFPYNELCYDFLHKFIYLKSF